MTGFTEQLDGFVGVMGTKYELIYDQLGGFCQGQDSVTCNALIDMFILCDLLVLVVCQREVIADEKQRFIFISNIVCSFKKLKRVFVRSITFISKLLFINV